MTNTIYIEIPNDMIWTTCDSDDYMADATESQFLDDLEKALLNAFDFEVSFDISLMLCPAVRIHSDEGDVDGETHALIKSIIDDFEVDYIEIGDFNEIEPDAIMADENPEMLESATRSIRPHKGGRTETVNARLTPDEKTALKTVTNAAGLSLSDWIMQQVNGNTTTGDNTMYTLSYDSDGNNPISWFKMEQPLYEDIKRGDNGQHFYNWYKGSFTGTIKEIQAHMNEVQNAPDDLEGFAYVNENIKVALGCDNNFGINWHVLRTATIPTDNQ